MLDLLAQRLFLQVFQYLPGVVHVPFHPQTQCLQPLQQQEGIERRDGCSLVAQQQCADACRERCGHIAEDKAVIRSVRLVEARELPGVCLPVEGAAVDDDTPEGSPVAADELCGGMYDDVGTVFYRADQVRCAERVVYQQRKTVAVGDVGRPFDVGDVGVGIAQRLDVDQPGVVLDGCLQFLVVVGVEEGGADAVFAQRVCQEIVRTAVDGLGGDDMIAGESDVGDGVGDGCCAGCDGKSCHTPFECSDTLFKGCLCRIVQPAVDVAGRLERKEVGSVLTVVEDVGGRLVDGHGT